MSGANVKFKRVRLLLDDLNSFVRGRYFRMVSSKVGSKIPDGWHLISDFPTNIKWRDSLGEINDNRILNMKRCAELIDGVRLGEGHIFSMRKLVGEPLPERGFMEGPMIIRGRTGRASGGGLCQVSSALFNAALIANLEIIEKHNHSVDIWGEERFIGLGRDAIYAYSRKDLKFANTHIGEIFIALDVDEENLVLNCRFYSPAKLEDSVEVETTVLKELGLPPGSNLQSTNCRYAKGWLVCTERHVSAENGGRRVTYARKEKYKPVMLDE